tara:strand:- start:64 stop:246 length:183 start_codon:yes stop_codon:yes gene_type:complete
LAQLKEKSPLPLHEAGLVFVENIGVTPAGRLAVRGKSNICKAPSLAAIVLLCFLHSLKQV